MELKKYYKFFIYFILLCLIQTSILLISIKIFDYTMYILISWIVTIICIMGDIILVYKFIYKIQND